MSENQSLPAVRQSNTKFEAVRYQDEKGDWRVKVVAQREKFDDAAKELFLAEYAKNARMGDSARAAGVTPPTVRRHLESDTDFAEACLAAEHEYRDRLIAHHQNLVFEGTTKTSYDRTGNIVSEEKIYPIRLIELELKKHDEGYRDKREVDMKVSGGVLVAPAEMSSIADWEAKFANGPVIEATAEGVEE